MRTPILIAVSWLLAGHPAAAEPAPVLVELFTSQGCSSCSPADRLLGELAQRADVAALAFHVTNWDRLGWPDSFGQPAWTDRQRAYAASLGTGGIYTPQMVVGGRLDVVGSDRSRVLAAIELAREHAPAALITFTDGRAHLPALTLAQPARLLLAAFEARAEVEIERGENGGRLLAYHHVVRSLTDLGSWGGGARVLPLPSLAAGAEGLALIAQDAGSGKVVALGQLTR